MVNNHDDNNEITKINNSNDNDISDDNNYDNNYLREYTVQFMP